MRWSATEGEAKKRGLFLGRDGKDGESLPLNFVTRCVSEVRKLIYKTSLSNLPIQGAMSSLSVWPAPDWEDSEPIVLLLASYHEIR